MDGLHRTCFNPCTKRKWQLLKRAGGGRGGEGCTFPTTIETILSDTIELDTKLIHSFIRFSDTSIMTLMLWQSWYDTDVMAVMVWRWCYGSHGMTLMLWHWCYGSRGMTLMLWHWCYGSRGMTLMLWRWCSDTDGRTLMLGKCQIDAYFLWMIRKDCQRLCQRQNLSYKNLSFISIVFYFSILGHLWHRLRYTCK